MFASTLECWAKVPIAMSATLPATREKTLLVYSAPKSGFGDEWMTFLPIGLGFLQAMLKSRGFACRVANLSGKSRKEILAYFRAQGAGVIGVSMFTFNRRSEEHTSELQSLV